MRRRRLPNAVFASLLALALTAPAQGATQLRQVRVELPAPPATPATPAGTLTLDFVFKNRPDSKHKFTPRQLTRIDFSKVPLLCFNGQGQSTSTLLLTRTLETNVKLKRLAPPRAVNPKPGRYAFNFVYDFRDFTGTISGTIDKRHGRGKPRSQGKFVIEDLDSDPGYMNCDSDGLRSWGGLPLTQA